MPAARGQTYGVTIGDYFYVFGGSSTMSTNNSTNSVYRYNRKTDVWDSPTTMPYSARELTAALLPNGFIHIAGGDTGSATYTTASYWYDPYNNTWTAKSNLPMGWVDGRIGALPDGRVLIAGGSINNQGFPRTALAYIYDPESDTYTAAPSMPFAVGNHVAATMSDGRIVHVAGVNVDNSAFSLKTQIFDPTTMSWSLGADQPVYHKDYAGISATPCGPVYVWGGNDSEAGKHGIKNVSSYDPSADTWSTLADLPFFAGWGAYGRFYDGQYIWASGHDNTAMTAKTYLSTDPVGD
jgi:N-acetylneuraminic acid mutarotase